MTKKIIAVSTIQYGQVRVPVQVYGPLGVQPHIYCDGPKPRLSEHSYGILHLASAHLITSDDWTLEEARALAQELSRLSGWERIPAKLPAKGQKIEARRAVGEPFRNEVMRILARHREWRRRGRSHA